MMSGCFTCIAVALLLLVSANAAPILARNVFRQRYACPLDAGLKLSDGQPLFGHSKTWRGLVCAVFCVTVVAGLLGFDPVVGGLFGLLSMLGDLFASFCKRRLGKTASSRARGLDTLPESLLPAWILSTPLGLSALDIVLLVVLFFVIEEFVSPLLYKWHIRKRPY